MPRETMLRRFECLLSGFREGDFERNSFAPWELEILIDFAACRLENRRRTDILMQYRNAVARQLRSSPGPPMKLSEFLVQREARRATWGKT